MTRDSDLSTVLDIISRRSRKAQTTVMDRLCNVLIICFGPRVSPLLFKGKAVEITSLVALFVAPSRVHVFSAASLSSIPTLLLLQSFSFSLTYTMAGADDQVYDDVVSREEEEYNAAIEAAVRGIQERPQVESAPAVTQFLAQSSQSGTQLPSSFPVQSHSSVSHVGVVPGVASLPAVQSLTSQALPSSGQAFSPPPPGSSGAVQVTRSLRTPAPGELGFTQEQIDAAPPLDLGLENLLRQCDVKEPLIQAFRVRGITDRFLFVALDETTEGLRSTCREALGVDTNFNFEHKLEFAKISKAWSSAKIASETKEKIDAVHRAHGEPVQMLEGDWVSLIRAFKVKYGKNIHPSRLPAQSYYESYEEKLSNTTWRAEPLTHVVSLQEEEKQKALRPEPARSIGIHLDSSLSIQTQRRFMSSVPTTIEDLRTKYKVMANMFLLAQMRQPSRHLYRGLEVNTFSDFLDELLSDRNFLMESDDDEKLVIPPWTQCLNYEFLHSKGRSPTLHGRRFRAQGRSVACSCGQRTPHAALDSQIDHCKRSSRHVQGTEAGAAIGCA